MSGIKSQILGNLSNKINQEHIIQPEETILGVPISEVKRQCQSCSIKSQFDQPLNYSQDYNDIVIEGGDKILNDVKTLKLVRKIYKNNE